MNQKNNEAFSEILVDVNRVTKVVKGGRKFSFAVKMVVGDKEGNVGHGHGKAKEVTEARTKATQQAKKNMIKVPLYDGRTIHHDVKGKSGAAEVVLRKAVPGTGIIAGGSMRAILELLGVHDIVAKSIGSNNTYAVINATFDALIRLSSPKMISSRRGLSAHEVMTRQNKI